MDVLMLQQTWDVPGPWVVSALALGTNNMVRRVETPGGSYVLRVYSNHVEPGRLRFERAILAQLAAMALPFALPLPLPTVTGAGYAELDTEDGMALATLTRFIAGEHPRRDDLEQALAGGETLGLLDVVLARIDSPTEHGGGYWRSYGDLAHCHELVPDPPAAIAALPVADAERVRLVAGYHWLIERIPVLYASLPRQLAHEDYAPDNLLMEGPRVTGVLDFEFCTRDVRVMDLTVARSWWPVAHSGTGAEWPIIAAVARGYARQITLTDAEIEAVPVLFQLRAYTSLIHRLGRWRAGLSPLEAVTGRAVAALERADWLEAHAARLMEVMGGASG
ncbi:MAG TPA: phosphotransferase [Ktedonobacterales bacterium]